MKTGAPALSNKGLTTAEALKLQEEWGLNAIPEEKASSEPCAHLQPPVTDGGGLVGWAHL